MANTWAIGRWVSYSLDWVARRGAPELPFGSVDDPKHWRDRAREMRALLDELTDGEIRATILRLADDYDRLAARAEERAGAVTKNGPK